MIYLSSVERMDNVAATSTVGTSGKTGLGDEHSPEAALQKVFVARSVSWSIVIPAPITFLLRTVLTGETGH